MRQRIEFDDARRMLRTRAQLREQGIAEREIATRAAQGTLLRVHRGFYVERHDWDRLWFEGQLLTRVCAVALAHRHRRPVFIQGAAAALWEIPLYGVRDLRIDVLASGVHSRTIAGVARHDMRVAEEDIVERHGVRCTSLERTVFDLARSTPAATAVAAADAALARAAVEGHRQDAVRAAVWREAQERLALPGLRGVRQARWVTEFADGRAQLPGESVSRLRLHQLGFTGVELQVPVTGSTGRQYFLDFAFRRVPVFGEFDGEGKYLEPDLRTEPTTAGVLLEEKHREDDVRGVTGRRFARWGHRHIGTADTLGARLAAFRVFPPG